jgi:arabinan endo-1,5-alpha-L-arabinosidase
MKIFVLILSITLPAMAQQPWEGNRNKVHDPSTLVRDGDSVWTFSTGMGVKLLKRAESGEWSDAGSIFERDHYPQWHAELVPGNRGHLWAPDVIRLGDKWFVYYSVSTFGKNTSAIGLVTGKTLDPQSDQFVWEDEGPVIRSQSSDRFNAIDPAIIADEGRLWMSFGSFWDGIMLIELSPRTGLAKDPKSKPLQLAHHQEIEAPFITRKGDWYYLFVNWGLCCRGVNSTYEIRVGRSRSIKGPYLDREGIKMLDGGGTLVINSMGDAIGPGHASIFKEDGHEWLVHHFYDGRDRGRSKMRMAPLLWNDGWPTVGKK